jgi:hypothetical protein
VSDGRLAWGVEGKVAREADMSDICTTAGYGGALNEREGAEGIGKVRKEAERKAKAVRWNG